MSTIFRLRSKEPVDVLAKPISSHQLWDKRDTVNVLFVCSDPVLARDFNTFAKPRGINANYAWSLEGLDFLPLISVNLAVISGDCWHSHEIFGRPVTLTLQSFPKIIVVQDAGESIPGGKQFQENVEYVQSREDMFAAVLACVSKAKKDSDHQPDFVRQ